MEMRAALEEITAQKLLEMKCKELQEEIARDKQEIDDIMTDYHEAVETNAMLVIEVHRLKNLYEPEPQKAKPKVK